MQRVARRRLAPPERREEVVSAASELFEAHPYDQLPIERIADACGVSVGLIYHHFGTKRGLYIACLERALDDFVGAIRDPGPELPLDRRLVEAMDSYLDFVADHPRSYRAVLRGGIGMDDEVHARVQGARERFCGLILENLGVADPDPEFVLALWGWMGFVEATCTRWLDRRDVERPELRDLLVESALAIFSRGLRQAA